jgi:hypothetical protein
MATDEPTGDRLRVGTVLKFGVLCLVALGVGAALLLLYAQVSARPSIAPASTAVPTEAVQQPIPAVIGSTGHLRTVGEYGYLVIFVDELGLSAWNRAYENRDQKGEAQVMSTFETLKVTSDTPVKVTNRRSDAIQVEMLSGQHAGRRGWTAPVNLIP